MSKQKAASEAPVRSGSFKTLGKVFEHNVPWLWLVINFIFSVGMGYFYVELPDITAKIAAGKIFDSSLITRFVLLSIIQTLCIVLASASNRWVGYFVERNIKRSVWKKLLHLPMKEYDREQPTSWISRIASDTTMATTFLTSIMEGLLCLIYLFIVFITVFSISTSIALAMLAVLPYLFLVATIPGKLKYKWAAARQDKLADYTNFVSEKIGSIRTIKACAMVEQDIQAGFAKIEECYQAEKTLAVIEAVCEPFAYLSQVIINLITIVMGGKLLRSGSITNANMMTLYLYGSNFYSFALMTISMYYTLRTSHGATRKIGELMFMEDESVTRSTDMPAEPEDLHFRHVTFSYGQTPVLKDVSFTVPHGKITAIVGPSGSGKSTVLGLIQRLYTPQSGDLLLGERNAEEIHLDQWRSHIGTVQQSCPLLNGSIADNIVYGADSVSEEELLLTAQKAGIGDFILSLPEGFQTNVGQLGDKLSGGQKQRIAIARMILKAPEILLLDEPTSSLDNETAYFVSKSLDELSKDKTVVIVAHNLSSIEHADHIICLKDGAVEAEGSKADVYAASETFRTYCTLQKVGVS